MNWEAAGAIGEIVGAVAVIATLIFLAFQIRQNTHAVNAQTLTALSDRTSQSNAGALSEYMASVIARGRESYVQLSEEEKVAFSYWMLDRIMTYELLVAAPDALSFEIIEACDFNLKYLFSAKGVREWWSTKDREHVSSAMEQYVDRLLRDA